MHHGTSPTPSSSVGPDCLPVRKRVRSLQNTRRHVASHLRIKNIKRCKRRKSMDLPIVLAVSTLWIPRKRPIQKEVAAHFLLSIEKAFYKIIRTSILADDAPEQTTPILCRCRCIYRAHPRFIGYHDIPLYMFIRII